MATHLLRIVVAGKEVVLYQNEKVKFLLKSPLMAVEPEAGSRIFSFKVPAEPNAHVFGFYSRLDSRKKPQTLDCDVYFGPTLFTKGKLDIVLCDTEEYEIKVRFDRSFYQEFSTKSLKDFEYNKPNPYRYNADKALHPYRDYGFNFGSLTIGNTFTITLTYTHPEDRINPITEVRTFTFDGSIGFFDVVVNTFVDYLTSTFNTTGFYSENIGSDTLRLYEYFNYVQLPELSFASSNPTFCNVTDLGDSVPVALDVLKALYNNSVNDPGFDYVFFPVHSPNLFEPPVSIGIFNGWMNMYSPKIAGNPSYPGVPNSSFLTPFPYVWQVLYQLHQEAGISIAQDLFFDDELKKLVYWTDQTINSSFRVPQRGWEGQRLLSFLYKNIVPNVLVADVIKDLRLFFNAIVDYNSRKSSIRILTVNSLLNNPEVDDINDKVLYGFENHPSINEFAFNYKWPGTEALATDNLPEIDKSKLFPSENFKDLLPAPFKTDAFEVRYTDKENNYYRWDAALGEWVFFAEELYGVKNASEEKQDVTAIGSPLFMRNFEVSGLNSFNLTKWIAATTMQNGNMYSQNQVENNIRYLFFRGWQDCLVRETTEGEDLVAEYPFGSAHNYNFNKEKIGNYSLSWNHEDGLKAVHWDAFIKFMQNTVPCVLQVNFSITDLINMDLLKKKLFKNVTYFFDEVEFEVTDKISISRVKAFPIKERNE